MISPAAAKSTWRARGPRVASGMPQLGKMAHGGAATATRELSDPECLTPGSRRGPRFAPCQQMIVAELMTENPVCVGLRQPLSEAARLMWECDCGALPVLDEEQTVRGMITDRDVCMATWMQRSAPQDLAVSGAMSERLYSCSPTDTLSTAEGLMRSKQVRRIPVLSDDGHLLGILSLADIVKATGFSSDMGLLASAVTLTLADICRPPLPFFSRQPSP
jgi:CBS domain-containing protein